jgi:hypothetical protein
MSHLRPCPGCARHVRANATACPFCDAAIDLDTGAPAVPQERLGRAALMAFGGAAVALSVAGCDPPKENIAMPYGAPPHPAEPDAGRPLATAPATASASSLPVASAAPSAAVTATATAKPTASTKTAPVPTLPQKVFPPYGAPPADGYDLFDV